MVHDRSSMLAEAAKNRPHPIYGMCSGRLVRYPPLLRATDRKSAEVLRSSFEKEDVRVNAALFILLRACDRFHALNNRYPGTFDRCSMDLSQPVYG